MYQLDRGICFLIYFGVFISIFLFVFLNSQVLFNESDFRPMLAAGVILREGMGTMLYDLELQRSVQSQIVIPPTELPIPLPFLYLPAVAILYMPFSYMSSYWAFNAYTILYLIFLFIAPFVTNRILFDGEPRWISFFLVVFPLSLHSVTLGQNSLFLFYAYLAVIWMIKRRNYTGAGLSSGVLLIKPQHLLFIPFIFILSKFVDSDFDVRYLVKFLSRFLLVTTFVIVTSLLVSGFGVFDYEKVLEFANTAYYSYRHHLGYTFRDFVANYYHDSTFTDQFVVNIFFYLATLLLFYVRRNKLSFNRAVSVAIIFTILSSIYNTELMLLFIPIILIIEESRGGKRLDKTLSYMIATMLFVVSVRTIVPTIIHPAALLFLSGILILFYKELVDSIYIIGARLQPNSLTKK